MTGETVISSVHQRAVLARLFSASVFRDLAKHAQSPLFARLIRDGSASNLFQECASVGDAFETAFSKLKRIGARDEYVYRAAITHKILLGTHSLKTASMLTEFRAGSCRADVVILNGTATAYEIKSERDSLSRLANQVENYRKVFAKVNVIANEGHLGGVIQSIPTDVGILGLSARGQISTVREAEDRPDRICPLTVLDSLRAGEALEILRALGVDFPSVPNIQRQAMLKAAFNQLDPLGLHIEMVRVLKKTRNLAIIADFVSLLPKSLQAAALSIQVKPGERAHVIKAVNTPLKVALGWS